MKRSTPDAPEPEKPERFQPPSHLSDRSQALWRELVPRRAKSVERLVLLTVALEALDRADKARQGIAETGMYSITPRTKMAHMSPLVKVERESRALFARIWSDLHLKTDPEHGWN